MNLRLAIFSTVIAASILVPLVLHKSAQARLRASAELLGQQKETATRLAAENEALSNKVAALNRLEPVSRERLAELLRLRAEVSRLQQDISDIENLRASNERLRLAQSNAASRLSVQGDPPQTLAYWPREQLINAGYSNPQSAFRTALWAASNMDLEVFLASMEPRLRTELERDLVKAGSTPEEQRAAFLNKISETFGTNFAGIRIVEEKHVSADRTVLDARIEHKDGTWLQEDILLTRNGHEWKLTAR